MSADSWITSGLWSLRSILQGTDAERPADKPRFPNDHPLHIALRTYVLALSLSLGPALVPFLKPQPSRKSSATLLAILSKELGPTGFAFAMTTAVGGGAALDYAWRHAEHSVQDKSDPHKVLHLRLQKLLRFFNLQPSQRTFLSNAISSLFAIALLQSRRRVSPILPITSQTKPEATGVSPTLDLTLLLFVRSIDTLVQRVLHHEFDIRPSRMSNEGPDELGRVNILKVARLTTRIDAFVFWAASARIMWCFFYQPERLPRSYVLWIRSLASIDQRLTDILRAIAEGNWSYERGSTTHKDVLASLAKDLGYPASWADPEIIPAFGGRAVNDVWRKLKIKGRSNVGGVPCEIVHGNIGNGLVGGSCLGNAGVRGIYGFLQALAIYTPVHLFPVLFTRPQALLTKQLFKTIASLCQSSLFLSTFISSIWYTICLTRTVVLARIFPNVSHDFWDGPYGCIMAGCLACGSSIWIENGRRRGEMALYVLPRALRASLSAEWLRNGSASVIIVERLTYAFSLATIMSAASHRPETLRGLTRWAVAFVLKGPEAGVWSRKGSKSPSPQS
ncbi:integral membrane protein [Rickenella mellea]|uniref:Integral membrane protein n=1 Tax=Rickenella mellea TaxID=50990 RepID=A0A4Y7QNG9_9AGAM|nr:integral membrane protein [Rickenella mellea]